MKQKFVLTLILLTLIGGRLMAQTEQLPLPHPVSDIELIDGKKVPMTFPYWGEKNLLIFYVDPDVATQNHDFTVEMEENKRAAGNSIYGFGILNLKDTWLPNGIVRRLAYNRTKKNGALIMADEHSLVRDTWNLGDINNKFVLMIVSKECELVYMHKGEFSEEEKAEFYRVVDQYRNN